MCLRVGFREVNMKIICPKCRKKEAVKILYGFPTFEAIEEARKGTIHLGGCIITGLDPQWHCNKCGYEW